MRLNARSLPLFALFAALASAVCAADVTVRLQDEIDAAFRAGGGTVTVEAGEWAVRGLRLRSNVTLVLKAGAVLKASRTCDDFDVLRNDAVEPLSEEEKAGWPAWLPAEKRPKGRHGTLNACSRWNRGVITIYRAHDVKIVGGKGAVIDGCNSFDPKGEEGFRGVHGIVARDSERVSLEGFELRRTGNWATRFFCCRDVSFRSLAVIGGHDGVHVRRCDRVTVDGCTLHCGDDCIAGFDNQDVTVENCDLNTACSAFRFGGRHVRIRNCRAWGPGLWPIRNSLPMEDRVADWAAINPAQRVCDYFFIFPLMHLDAKDPRNYVFGPTDYLLKRTREETKLDVFFRLGTTIEHSGDKVHFNALVPDDFEKVAEIFAGTVRHYNCGWANGYKWGIRYWEIWNEPEGDRNMWFRPEKTSYVEYRQIFCKFFVTCMTRRTISRRWRCCSRTAG